MHESAGCGSEVKWGVRAVGMLEIDHCGKYHNIS